MKLSPTAEIHPWDPAQWPVLSGRLLPDPPAAEEHLLLLRYEGQKAQRLYSTRLGLLPTPMGPVDAATLKALRAEHGADRAVAVSGEAFGLLITAFEQRTGFQDDPLTQLGWLLWARQAPEKHGLLLDPPLPGDPAKDMGTLLNWLAYAWPGNGAAVLASPGPDGWTTLALRQTGGVLTQIAHLPVNGLPVPGARGQDAVAALRTACETALHLGAELVVVLPQEALRLLQTQGLSFTTLHQTLGMPGVHLAGPPKLSRLLRLLRLAPAPLLEALDRWRERGQG